MPKGNATKEFIESLQLKPGQVVYKCPKCCSIKPDRAHHCRYPCPPPNPHLSHALEQCPPLLWAPDHCDSLSISVSSPDWKGHLVWAQDTCPKT